MPSNTVTAKTCAPPPAQLCMSSLRWTLSFDLSPQIELKVASVSLSALSDALRPPGAGCHPVQDEDQNVFLFQIVDHGKGMTSQEAAATFQPFQRLQRHEAIKGSGIGLSNCKMLVELHGGKIAVRDTEGMADTIQPGMNSI